MTQQTFRRRKTEVTAMQFAQDLSNFNDIYQFLFVDGYDFEFKMTGPGRNHFQTYYGWANVNDGDWLVLDEQQRLQVMNPDAFEYHFKQARPKTAPEPEHEALCQDCLKPHCFLNEKDMWDACVEDEYCGCGGQVCNCPGCLRDLKLLREGERENIPGCKQPVKKWCESHGTRCQCKPEPIHDCTFVFCDDIPFR